MTAHQNPPATLRDAHRNVDQTVEVVIWDDHRLDCTYFVTRDTATETQLSCHWVSPPLTADEARIIAVRVMDEARPVFTSESAAVQAWIDGDRVVCVACLARLDRRNGCWLHAEPPVARSTPGHDPFPVIADPADAAEQFDTALAPPRTRTDASVLNGIAGLLDRREWEAANLNTIEELVSATGRVIREPDDGAEEAGT